MATIRGLDGTSVETFTPNNLATLIPGAVVWMIVTDRHFKAQRIKALPNEACVELVLSKPGLRRLHEETGKLLAELEEEGE